VTSAPGHLGVLTTIEMASIAGGQIKKWMRNESRTHYTSPNPISVSAFPAPEHRHTAQRTQAGQCQRGGFGNRRDGCDIPTADGCAVAWTAGISGIEYCLRLRVAIFRRARNRRLHIIGTFIGLRIFQTRVLFCRGRTRTWRGKFSAGWCAACCNVQSDYGISKCIGARAGNGSRRSYGLENF
jgi:hypothetical protein